jgi:c-di-GMP-binding flagellar brake protein YcgR
MESIALTLFFLTIIVVTALFILLNKEARKYIQSFLPQKVQARKSGIERRKFKRANAQLKIRCEYLNSIDFVEISSRDISIGGLSLNLDRKLIHGSKLSMEIGLPGDKAPFFVEGEVVWVKILPKDKGRKYYSTGIRFLGLEKGELEKIERFVEQKPAV